MILLYYIIEIFDLTDSDSGAILLVVALDGGCMDVTAVNRDRLREPVPADRFLEKLQRRLCVPVLGQQKVNRLSMLIHGAIQVVPLPFHANIRLVHAPTHPHGALAAVKGVFQLRAVFDHPALDGGVVDWHPALLHQFFDLAIAQRVRDIPPYTHENDVLRKMGALKADHPCSPLLVQFKFHREIIPEIAHE
jgi:hypothetical protein